MPASRCVVQDCTNGSNPREGISLHNSPPSGSILSSWKRFVSSHRKNFDPTCRFVVCSKHITDDCLAKSYHVGGSMKRLVEGAIPSVWKKKLKSYLVSVLIKRYKHFNVHFNTVKDNSFSMHVRVSSCAT